MISIKFIDTDQSGDTLLVTEHGGAENPSLMFRATSNGITRSVRLIYPQVVKLREKLNDFLSRHLGSNPETLWEDQES